MALAIRQEWRWKGYPDGVPLPGPDFDSQKVPGRAWRAMEKSMSQDIMKMEKWSVGESYLSLR